MPSTPKAVATSNPNVVNVPVRKVAAAIDAIVASQGGAVTWNATRTEGTLVEDTPLGPGTMTFRLAGAGAGKTALVVELSLESELLAIIPAGVLEAQLAQGAEQISGIIAQAAVEQHQAGGPDLAA